MNTFTPLFSGLVESSIWDEPYHVRILFVSMLALKDFDHVVRRNQYQLSKRSNITLDETEEALKILSSPDERRPGQPFEGRRIEQVEDGWFVLNGQFYEDQMRKVSRRFYKARKQREYRRAADSKSAPSGREQRFVAAHNNGDAAAADAIAAEGLSDVIPSEQQQEEE